MKCPAEFDPRLVEEAVHLALRGRGEERAFHREREPAYGISDPEDRDREFARIGSHWFRRLGLGDPLRCVLVENRHALRTLARCLVTQAPSSRQAGAELYVSDSGEQTLLIRIVPSVLVQEDHALEFLRRELLHVTDMLDPAFEYEPRLGRSPSGPGEDRMLRDRYGVLWNCSVEGRLVRSGKSGADGRARCLSDFRRSFACLGDHAEICFERIFSGERPRHSHLVALASDPRTAFGTGGETPPSAGGRCPLCKFPASAFEPFPEKFPRRLLEEIGVDFPSWRPESGICRQCADLYRALIPLPAADSERADSANS